VIYLAAEGAWHAQTDRRVSGPQSHDQAPFYLISARPDLGFRPGDSEELRAGIRAQIV
jgi:hypothetical protein